MMSPGSFGNSIRVGVIGLGRIAGLHLPALNSFPEVRIAALADFRDDRRAELGQKYAVTRLYATAEQMLHDGDLDAVWVLTSIQYTVEVAIACLQAGLHVFVEKPPGLHAEETLRMAQVARRMERINMVGFNRRFNPLVRAAREEFAERPIAHLLSQWHKDNLPRIRDLLGDIVARTLLRNDLIHPLDLLRFFGGEVRQIHGLRRRRFTEWEDAFDALIEFEGGAVGHLVSGHKAPKKIERFQIVGEDVMVDLEGEDNSFVRATVWEPARRRELKLDNQKRTDRFGFWDEDRFFIDHLKRNAPVRLPGADLAEAVKSVQMADSFLER